MSTGLVGVDVVWVVLGAIAVVPLLLMLLEVGYRVIKPSVPLQGTHVIVVGGSTGIGLSMAIQAAKERARAITLVSRSQEKLQAARQAVLASAADPGCAVDTISADATNFKTMAVAIDSAVQTHGPPDYLICAAGASHPGYFLQQPVETFRDSMELNYMGTVVCLKAAVPHMAAVRQGHCILISSGAGLSGWLGYSSYSPTKFAIRGLAEALRNELTGFNIKVSIAYPPDTDTPGFEHENKTKPVRLCCSRQLPWPCLTLIERTGRDCRDAAAVDVFTGDGRLVHMVLGRQGRLQLLLSGSHSGLPHCVDVGRHSSAHVYIRCHHAPDHADRRNGLPMERRPHIVRIPETDRRFTRLHRHPQNALAGTSAC